MKKVLLQAAASPQASANFHKTIETSVPLKSIAPYVDASFLGQIKRTYPNGGIYVWGLNPRTGQTNPNTWARITPGTLVLFSGPSGIRSAAIVTLTYRSSSLAKQLWDLGRNGKPYELIYFVRDPRRLKVGYADFNRAAGYKKDFVIQGTMFPTSIHAALILKKFSTGWRLSADEELSLSAEEATEEGVFDATNMADERQRALADIVRRQGQPEFRRKLLEAYGGRCVLTDCDVEYSLEAAHILPYKGPKSNHPSNGLLLRADLHNLFDLGRIRINPKDLAVSLDSSLSQSCYRLLHGRKLRPPHSAHAGPDRKALAKRLAYQTKQDAVVK